MITPFQGIERRRHQRLTLSEMIEAAAAQTLREQQQQASKDATPSLYDQGRHDERHEIRLLAENCRNLRQFLNCLSDRKS